MDNLKLTKYDATDFKDIKETIKDACSRYGEKLAFVIKHKDENKKVTYEEISYNKLYENIVSLGTAFWDMGLKGKRVAIIGKNRYEWLVANYANLFGAGISVPLDKDLQVDELESSLIRSEAEAIIFDPKQKEKIIQIKENGNTKLSTFISMDEDEDFDSIRALISKGENLPEEAKKDFLNAEIDENKMAILLFTSGTTSKSKAVMLSQRNIASCVYAMRRVEDIRETDTNIAFLPFHHIFGSTCMVMMLASGVKTVFPDGLKYIKQNLCEYKVTIFIGVPVLTETIYKTIMHEVKKQGKEKTLETGLKVSNALRKVGIDVRRKLFKSVLDALGGQLRSIIVGGAPADPKIMKGFNDLGIKTVQGYGLTETSPVICAESDITKNSNGTIGLPMCNVELEIFEPDDEGIGQIRVKGPNVMLGYYNMEEQTNEVLKDGWFYTGDLGYLDKRGYLVITGRSKNLIVLKNGKKVFPEELETMVSRIELVEECMVFGMPDEKDKNDVTLKVKIVYNKEEAKKQYPDKSYDDIYDMIWNKIKELNTTFPNYKHIKGLILTDEELIKTTTKKVKRQEEMKKILAENK